MSDAKTYSYHYEKACALMQGRIFLDGNLPNIGWWDKFQLKRAIKHFRMAIALEKRSWQAHWLSAKIFQAIQSNEEAISSLESALAAGSDNYNVQRELSYQYMLSGNGKLAAKYAEMAAEMDRNNSGLWCNYALSLLINQETEKAVQMITRACEMEQHPNNISTKKLIDDVKSGKRPPITRLLPGGRI